MKNNTLVGTTIGSLLVIKRYRHGFYVGYCCLCECGKNIKISEQELLSGTVTDCGHSKPKVPKTKVDYTGKRFGYLVIIGRGRPDKEHGCYWKCLCDCGNIVERRYDYLKGSSIQTYCGDISCKYHIKVTTKLDLVGVRYGYLTCIERNERYMHGGYEYLWKCQCDCGNIVYFTHTRLKAKTHPYCSIYCILNPNKPANESQKKERQRIYSLKRYNESKNNPVIKAKKSEYARQWRKNNPDKMKAIWASTRRRRRASEGFFEPEDVLRQGMIQQYRCYYCKDDISKNYEIEHKVPLSRGGTNYPDNIVLACRHCNRDKGTKTPEEWVDRWYYKEGYW